MKFFIYLILVFSLVLLGILFSLPNYSLAQQPIPAPVPGTVRLLAFNLEPQTWESVDPHAMLGGAIYSFQLAASPTFLQISLPFYLHSYYNEYDRYRWQVAARIEISGGTSWDNLLYQDEWQNDPYETTTFSRRNDNIRREICIPEEDRGKPCAVKIYFLFKTHCEADTGINFKLEFQGAWIYGI